MIPASECRSGDLVVAISFPPLFVPILDPQIFSPLPARIVASKKPLSFILHSFLTPAPSTRPSLSLYLPVSSTPTPLPPGEPSPSSLHQRPSPVACQCRAHSSPPKLCRGSIFQGGRGRRTALLRRSCGFNLFSPTGSPALSCVSLPSPSVSNHTFHSFIQPSHIVYFSTSFFLPSPAQLQPP